MSFTTAWHISPIVSRVDPSLIDEAFRGRAVNIRTSKSGNRFYVDLDSRVDSDHLIECTNSTCIAEGIFLHSEQYKYKTMIARDVSRSDKPVSCGELKKALCLELNTNEVTVRTNPKRVNVFYVDIIHDRAVAKEIKLCGRVVTLTHHPGTTLVVTPYTPIHTSCVRDFLWEFDDLILDVRKSSDQYSLLVDVKNIHEARKMHSDLNGRSCGKQSVIHIDYDQEQEQERTRNHKRTREIHEDRRCKRIHELEGHVHHLQKQVDEFQRYISSLY